MAHTFSLTISYKGTKEPRMLKHATATDVKMVEDTLAHGTQLVLLDRGWAPAAPADTWPRVVVNVKQVNDILVVPE